MSFTDSKLFVGVGLAVGSSIISNLGLNLQKLTHVRIEARKAQQLEAQRKFEEHLSTHPSATPRPDALHEPLIVREDERFVPTSPGCPFYLQPMWLLGISLVVAGAVADFMALGFADQIIVAPIGSMTLVTNLLFAPFFSKEHLSKMDVLATIVIVCGCTVAVIFARPEQPVEYTMASFLEFYSDPRFLFYVIAIVGIVALVYRGIVKVESSLKRFERARDPTYKLVHERRGSVEDERMDLLNRLAGEWWGRIVLLEYTRFGYACISGITGAQSVMFAKAIAVTFVNGEWEYFMKPLTYVILVGLCCSVYLQLKWSNKALQHFDALYVVPVFQAFWIGFSIISGMIVYQESEKLTWLQLGLFSVGVVITMSGIYILSQHAEAHTSKDRVRSQQEKDSIIGNRSRAASVGSTGAETRRGSWQPVPLDCSLAPALETIETVEIKEDDVPGQS